MNKIVTTSLLTAAGLALATGTLSAGALASTADRSGPTFPSEVTGLNASMGVNTIVSDVAPIIVGALNIDTGHVGQRDTGRTTERETRSSRSASSNGTA